MKHFQNKVVVVTGGASGIGRAIAEKSAALGMKIVLADVEESALKQTKEDLQAKGAEITAFLTDVSSATDVEALARFVFSRYGAVHLLFNNAGVTLDTSLLKSTLADWQWVLGVNLWGVIYGVHSFAPRMLAQGSEGYIVNTASAAGLISQADRGCYTVSKHGVVALSEALALELAAQDARLQVSVFCPGLVNTRIAHAERNRSHAMRQEQQYDPQQIAKMQLDQERIQAAMPPEQAAEIVFDAIAQGKFYILTDPTIKPGIQLRMEDMLQERQPTDLAAFARR
jgi:NAD(P)-dependent dehydrogenase (short-subunit alcohol dehydrogenase family)